jgi:hypothetical protein
MKNKNSKKVWVCNVMVLNCTFYFLLHSEKYTRVKVDMNAFRYTV